MLKAEEVTRPKIEDLQFCLELNCCPACRTKMVHTAPDEQMCQRCGFVRKIFRQGES